MNINAASTQFSNAVTPFAASPSSELTNPINASPIPPIKQADNSERAGDRDPRQAQAQVSQSEDEDAANEPEASARPSQAAKKVAGQELTEQELATLMQLQARDC